MATKSALGVDNVFEEINGHPDNLFTFQTPLQCSQDNLLFSLNDLPFRHKDLDRTPLFNDFIQQFLDSWYIVATDASKYLNITSIAGCTVTTQSRYRIHPVNSIFTAEAAIGTAIDDLDPWNRPIILITDSLSVLKAVSINSPRVILWLFNKLQRAILLTPKIWICWIPGHRSISFKEQADRIARKVTDSDVMLNWISPDDLI